MIQLLMSLAMTHIDYCNSVLAGLPASTLAPLQRVQNSTARLILGLDQRPQIIPALCKNFNGCRAVKYRVFKVAEIMHSIFRRRSSPYLSDLATFCVHGRSDPPLFVEQQLSSADVRLQTELDI